MENPNKTIIEQQVDIKSLILTVRGMQVLLDSDVAMLYGYETKQKLKRFCFQGVKMAP